LVSLHWPEAAVGQPPLAGGCGWSASTGRSWPEAAVGQPPLAAGCGWSASTGRRLRLVSLHWPEAAVGQSKPQQNATNMQEIYRYLPSTLPHRSFFQKIKTKLLPFFYILMYTKHWGWFVPAFILQHESRKQ